MSWLATRKLEFSWRDHVQPGRERRSRNTSPCRRPPRRNGPIGTLLGRYSV